MPPDNEIPSQTPDTAVPNNRYRGGFSVPTEIVQSSTNRLFSGIQSDGRSNMSNNLDSSDQGPRLNGVITVKTTLDSFPKKWIVPLSVFQDWKSFCYFLSSAYHRELGVSNFSSICTAIPSSFFINHLYHVNPHCWPEGLTTASVELSLL
ncbi:hypothetical protein BDD12DRAFT_886150 [Trichophaea hybrida]|nr:hypothetical protein BDD12DRAFT_886150 [Trichophaea hybrida]